MNDLTDEDKSQMADILSRRANEIAGYMSEYTKNPNHFGSVESALTREISRLRALAEKLKSE